MSQNMGQQGAHGIGQIEQQLNQQAEAAEQMQGLNEADKDVQNAANRNQRTELDEVIEP